MKNNLRCLFIALALLAGINQAAAQGTTAFTYQGQLHDGGTNANGVYTMTFALYDDLGSGNQIGGTVSTTPTLANGLFTVNLDFGAGAFDGSARWLDITISEGGTTQDLSPRVQVLPAPYALFANTATNLSGILGGGQLAGIYSNTVTLNNPGNSLSGNGGGVTNVNAAMLGGFSSSNFVTLNGLSSSNYIQLAIDPKTGILDLIAPRCKFATNIEVVGTAAFESEVAFYGSPHFTTNVYFGGDFGGFFNPGEPEYAPTVDFYGITTFETNANFFGNAQFSAAASFETNVYVGAPGNQWQIGQMTAIFDTNSIPNCLSFLNGGTMQMAIAPPGVTVDNQPAGLAVFGSLAVLNGSVEISSGKISLTKGNLRVHDGNFNLENGDVFIGGGLIVTNDVNCGSLAVTGGATVTGTVTAADVYAANLVYSTIVAGNAVAAKSSLSSLNSQDILNQVASLPISTWGSKRDAKTHHVGPMAHDFQAAFGLGKDDQTISLVDETGVALAAIQALNEKLKEKDAQIATLNKRLGDLEQIVKTSTQK